MQKSTNFLEKQIVIGKNSQNHDIKSSKYLKKASEFLQKLQNPSPEIENLWISKRNNSRIWEEIGDQYVTWLISVYKTILEDGEEKNISLFIGISIVV